MKNMTPNRMAQACGGTYIGRTEDADREITSITTDSRKAEPGGAFAAIKGERVDGHDFIPGVFETGALVVISEKQPVPEGSGNYILVEAYDQSARRDRRRTTWKQLDIPVVGITGSVGKTSTKEMIAVGA